MNRDPIGAEDIEQIVQMVVRVANPERVVLFGSAARGDRDAADIDLMVVVPEGVNERAVAGDLHMAMLDRSLPLVSVDFVVTTATNFEANSHKPWYVYHGIAKDGRDVYVAA